MSSTVGHQNYDENLLASAPVATKAQLQSGYNPDLLAEKATPPPSTRRGHDLEAGIPAADNGEAVPSPPSPKTPFYRTKKGVIIIVVALIVVIAAVVGGAVGGTVKKKSPPGSTDQTVAPVSSDPSSSATTTAPDNSQAPVDSSTTDPQASPTASPPPPTTTSFDLGVPITIPPTFSTFTADFGIEPFGS